MRYRAKQHSVAQTNLNWFCSGHWPDLTLTLNEDPHADLDRCCCLVFDLPAKNWKRLWQRAWERSNLSLMVVTCWQLPGSGCCRWHRPERAGWPVLSACAGIAPAVCRGCPLETSSHHRYTERGTGAGCAISIKHIRVNVSPPPPPLCFLLLAAKVLVDVYLNSKQH